MSWNSNQDLDPWELPDRPLNQGEGETDTSAGAQWVRRQEKKRAAQKAARKAARQAAKKTGSPQTGTTYEVPPASTWQAGTPATKPGRTQENFVNLFRSARRLSNLGAVGVACYALLFLAVGVLFALPRIREVYFWEEAGFAWLLSAVMSGAALVLFVLAFAFLKRNRAGAIAALVVAILLLFTSGFWGFGGGTACFVAPLLFLSAMGLMGVLTFHRVSAAASGIPHDVVYSAKAPRTLGGTMLFLFFILCALGSVLLLTLSISSFQKEPEALDSWAEDLTVWSEAPEPEEGETAPAWSVEEAEEETPEEEAEPELSEPFDWEMASLPDTGLAMPMPSNMELYEGDSYWELFGSGGNTYAYSIEWMKDSQLGSLNKDTAMEVIQGMLDGYGSAEDERVAVPVASGETQDGILYAQISVECDYGYVYTTRSFSYGDIIGWVTYTQFEPPVWSQEYETAVTDCFNQLHVE